MRLLVGVVDTIIGERRTEAFADRPGKRKEDLLDRLMVLKDPETNERLSGIFLDVYVNTHEQCHLDGLFLVHQIPSFEINVLPSLALATRYDSFFF